VQLNAVGDIVKLTLWTVQAKMSICVHFAAWHFNDQTRWSHTSAITAPFTSRFQTAHQCATALTSRCSCPLHLLRGSRHGCRGFPPSGTQRRRHDRLAEVTKLWHHMPTKSLEIPWVRRMPGRGGWTTSSRCCGPTTTARQERSSYMTSLVMRLPTCAPNWPATSQWRQSVSSRQGPWRRRI